MNESEKKTFDTAFKLAALASLAGGQPQVSAGIGRLQTVFDNLIPTDKKPIELYIADKIQEAVESIIDAMKEQVLEEASAVFHNTYRWFHSYYHRAFKDGLKDDPYEYEKGLNQYLNPASGLAKEATILSEKKYHRNGGVGLFGMGASLHLVLLKTSLRLGELEKPMPGLRDELDTIYQEYINAAKKSEAHFDKVFTDIAGLMFFNRRELDNLDTFSSSKMSHLLPNSVTLMSACHDYLKDILERDPVKVEEMLLSSGIVFPPEQLQEIKNHDWNRPTAPIPSNHWDYAGTALKMVGLLNELPNIDKAYIPFDHFAGLRNTRIKWEESYAGLKQLT